MADEQRRGQMTVQEAGRLGGQKGGRRTAQTHGREFYEAIGHKGGQKVRRLIQKGKIHQK